MADPRGEALALRVQAVGETAVKLEAEIEREFGDWFPNVSYSICALAAVYCVQRKHPAATRAECIAVIERLLEALRRGGADHG